MAIVNVPIEVPDAETQRYELLPCPVCERPPQECTCEEVKAALDEWRTAQAFLHVLRFILGMEG